MRRGLILCLLPLTAFAAVDPSVLQKKARARMKSLDFDAALPLLEQLKADPSLTPKQKSDALIDLGITHVNLGQTEEAKRDFDDALGVDESARPPSSTSPKVQRVFEEAKEARNLRLNPPPPEPKPEPPPAAPPEPVKPAQLEPAPKAVAPVVIEEAPPPPKQRLVVVPLVLALAGAGALAAGAVFAMQTQSIAREEQTSLHPGADVMALESRRSTFGVLTYVGYGGGAVLLAAGAALFIFSGSF